MELKQSADTISFSPLVSTLEIMGKIDSKLSDSGVLIVENESGPIQVTQGNVLIELKWDKQKKEWKFSGLVNKSQFKKLNSD